MAELLKGPDVANAMDEALTKEIEALKAKGITPTLNIVVVGDAGPSMAYTNGAKKTAEKIGMGFELKQFPEAMTQDDFIVELKKLNEDKNVHGILIMRPMPAQMNEDVIKYVIAAEKDVDCFNPLNAGKLMFEDPTCFPPCTPTAVMEMIDHFKIETAGKNVVVLGRSMVVGKPAAVLAVGKGKDATVTICHSKTKDLDKVCASADVLIAAVGRAKMVKASWVKPGAAILDVGINFDENGKMCGDVDFEEAEKVAGSISPVPGGVGSVTTRVLAKHVVKAAKQLNGLA